MALCKRYAKKRSYQLFDRSWYGRVLVERIEGFATVNEWQRAYDEINAFERCGRMKVLLS